MRLTHRRTPGARYLLAVPVLVLLATLAACSGGNPTAPNSHQNKNPSGTTTVTIEGVVSH